MEWTDEEIEIFIKSSKNLISLSVNEYENPYILLQGQPDLICTLRNKVKARKPLNIELLSVLNAILLEVKKNLETTRNEFNFMQWFPDFVMQHFRKSIEKICLLIETKSIDLVIEDGSIIQWNSRSKMSVHMKPSDGKGLKNLIKFSQVNPRYGLVFDKKCIYHCSGNNFLSSETNVLLVMTFSVREKTGNEQVIISDYYKYISGHRGISITDNELILYGADNEENLIKIPLIFNAEWLTLVIMWGGISLGQKSFYKITDFKKNEKEDFFFSNKMSSMDSDQLCLGGLEKNNSIVNDFHGSISNVEIAHSTNTYPNDLINLLLSRQQ